MYQKQKNNNSKRRLIKEKAKLVAHLASYREPHSYHQKLQGLSFPSPLAMADEFGAGGNWWDSSSSRNRFDSGASSTSSSGLTSIGSFGWLADMGDVKARAASMDHSSPNISISSSGSGGGSVGFHHLHHHHDAHKLTLGAESSTGSNLAETSLHMMNLGLSSQAMHWNQQQPNALLRGEKVADSGFRSMLQDNMSSNTNFAEENGDQVQWRSENYMLHGMLGSENHHQHNSGFENRSVNNTNTYPNYATMNYGLNADDQQLLPSNNNWSKVPQFMRVTPRKQAQSHAAQLQFSNNAPFWNATSGTAAVTDVRPGLFPPVQTQFPASSFDEKPKNLLDMADSGTTTVKKSGGEAANKRPRNESNSQTPLPAFKVRKEKMGDRITALQQLVSPFGKTDTASVLSEVIEYIKFLHEQVSVLSTPYMKSGAIQHHHHHQNSDKSKFDAEGPRQDLRSRGLCLVPLSSTFPVTSHESNVDFWNPTFGGTFR